MRCPIATPSGMKHRWLWLTKRPRRMADFHAWLRHNMTVQWPRNLWVGTSVTTQATVSRVKDLLRVGNDHTVRFVSLEPQWESVSSGNLLPQIDWLIQGGESGTVRHPFDIAWADHVRTECRAAGASYFLKQLGSHVLLDGRRVRLDSSEGNRASEWPKRLRVRQMPR